MSRNRLTVRTRAVEGAPVVAVRVWTRGGAREESTPGQALISGRMLTEGTERRSWKAISQAAESRGASVGSFGDLEIRGISVDALASDWQLALDWAAELALESAFPEDRCAWSARQAEGELASIADHPDASTGFAFLDQLYAPHPAGRPLQGSTDSLARLTPDDFRSFHRRSIEAGLIVSVAGRIEPRDVDQEVRERFAEVQGETVEWESPAPPRGSKKRRTWAIKGDQAHLFAGHLTVHRDHPALPAMRLLSVILGAGGGLSGRIPHRVREQEGLAYATSVDTASGAALDPGRLVIHVGTAPESVERALAAVTEELERVREEGVTEREVTEARSYLLGRDPFRRETARQWADLMAAAVHYGVPLDDPQWIVERLKGAGRKEVEAAARELLRPHELQVTVGTPS